MTEKALEIALGVLTGAECSHFFFGRLPSRMTTRKFTDEHDRKQNLIALVESCFMGFILALIVSLVMRSWIVFFIAITVMSLLALLYLNDIKGWW